MDATKDTAASHLELDVVAATAAAKERKAAGGLARTIRIRFFRNHSVEMIEPFLRYYFSGIGFDCDIAFGGFDTIEQEILGGEDFGQYDLVVVSLILDGLAPDWPDGTAAEDVLGRITGIADAIAGKSSGPVLLNTFIRPLLDAEGTAAAQRADSATSRTIAVNQGLRQYAASQPRCLLIDWERLVMAIGYDATVDRRMGYIAAQPFRHGFLSLYAHEIFLIGRALKGGAKKCLILDCDNTLWGGVIGEDGMDGIALDRNRFPGKAFYDFQKAVLRLVDQGVMVALCTKNNHDDVMNVLDHHPHCLLKRKHLVGYRINWQDKEKNIEALIEELNIGIDAAVFVDDNPTECARVQAFLPDLTVRMVPKQLSNLPILLSREGLFDKLAVTAEDLKRVQLYQAEAKRRETAATFKTPEEFLASLSLSARIETAAPSRVARVAQLTQKTNQFNLTTRRYSEGDVERMLASDDWAVLTLTASDRFGDLGLTGVFIARRAGADAVVDTLLMSCRVLGRKLEHEFVATCIEQLNERWRPRSWTAEYVKTRKNEQVAGFWPVFGFIEVRRDGDSVHYRADASALTLQHFTFINKVAA